MANIFDGNIFTGNVGEVKVVSSLIDYFFSHETLRALMHLCLRYDIPDNNLKADVVGEILGPTFERIGVGTNRIALLHHGVIVKVALDRRGLIDNLSEFRRSMELPDFLTRTYETNYLINVCEYIEVMDQDRFLANEDNIKRLLKQLGENYLFDDIGFTLKNSYNWGCRESNLTQEERELLGADVEYVYDICILDYGYLYPLHGQQNRLLRCPKCRHQLHWNNNYTAYSCVNSSCNFQINPMDLRRSMDTSFEEVEDRIAANLNAIQMPDLSQIEHELNKLENTDVNEEEEEQT